MPLNCLEAGVWRGDPGGSSTPFQGYAGWGRGGGRGPEAAGAHSSCMREAAHPSCHPGNGQHGSEPWQAGNHPPQEVFPNEMDPICTTPSLSSLRGHTGQKPVFN